MHVGAVAEVRNPPTLLPHLLLKPHQSAVILQSLPMVFGEQPWCILRV